jgi:hypothetical protein
MTRIDALAIALIAKEDDAPIKWAENMWAGSVEEAGKSGHMGDCTKEPNPCLRCFVDRRRAEAEKILNYVEDSSR